MSDVLIGNIFSLLAAVSDSISGTRKNAKSILCFQILSQFLHAATNFVLKGYSALVQNAIAVLRNLLAISQKRIVALEWILTVAAVVLGLVFNNMGIIGLLPVFANFEYTVCIFRYCEEERKIKISFVVNMIMYSVFNLFIKNYVGMIMDFSVAITTLISLLSNRQP